jgi:D-galactose 1-dehydrogenase
MIHIAIVGGGKIARDQHVPSIAANDDFTLVAAVTTARSPLPGVPNFRTITEMKAAVPSVNAVALCTPPQDRHAQVLEALAAGLDILNEKPPAATVSMAEDFAARAKEAGRVLYQTWHSREAAAVEPAAAWLKGKHLSHVAVTWKEDVRVWHPGQEWIWAPGIGVFDPGINAISVITQILPHPLALKRAELRFPQNKDAPIAVSLAYADTEGLPVAVEFDFDQKGPQTWDIDVETDGGALKLSMGASQMAVDGKPVNVGTEPGYARLYRRFAALVKAGGSDADFTPFRHVADAFMFGRRVTVAPFA